MLLAGRHHQLGTVLGQCDGEDKRIVSVAYESVAGLQYYFHIFPVTWVQHYCSAGT